MLAKSDYLFMHWGFGCALIPNQYQHDDECNVCLYKQSRTFIGIL